MKNKGYPNKTRIRTEILIMLRNKKEFCEICHLRSYSRRNYPNAT